MKKHKILSMLLVSTIILAQVAPALAQTQEELEANPTEHLTEVPEKEEGAQTKEIDVQAQDQMQRVAFDGGQGTETAPYLISNAHQLHAMREDLTAHYKLTADIDLRAPIYAGAYDNWEPIGRTQNNPDLQFSGSLDGAGHTISNLTISRNLFDVGLFGVVRDAELKNIHIVNANITGTANRWGILVGSASRTAVSNNSVSGLIQGGNEVGGLIGRITDGLVYENYSSASVRSSARTAGLVAMAQDTSIHSNYMTGDVTSSGLGEASGIVGFLSGTQLSVVGNYVMSGSISMTSGTQIGAIVGHRSSLTQNNYQWEGTQIITAGASSPIGVNGQPLSIQALRSKATYVENGWNFAPDAWVWQESQHFPGFGFSGETDTLPIATVGETKTVTYNGSTHPFPVASLFTSFGAGATLEDFDFELFKDDVSQAAIYPNTQGEFILPADAGAYRIVARANNDPRTRLGTGQSWMTAHITVIPKPVSLSGRIHLSRPWTGNNSFTITSEDLSNVILPAILPQDVDHAQLNLIGMTGTSPSSNVGEGTFTPTTPITLTGSRAGNHSLEIDSEFAITTEILQPQENLIDGLEQRQNYQGQKIEVPIATLFDFEAPVSIEDLEFSLEGGNLEVSGNNIILEEANVGNYAIKAHHQPTGQEATGTFIIEKAQLELDRQGAIAPRPFDGTTAVNVTTAPTLKGFAQDEGGTLQLDNLRYTSADAGTDTIELDGWSLDWAGETIPNNYLLPNITEAKSFFTEIGGITRAQGASLKMVQESSLILEARVRAELTDDASQLHQDFWTDEIRPAVLYSLYAENPEEHPDTPIITSNKTGLFTNLRPATTYFIRATAGETTNFEAGQSSELLQVQTDDVQVTHDFGTPQPVLRSELQDLTGNALQDKLLELLDWDPTQASDIEIGGEAIDPEKYEVRLQLVETLAAPGNFSVALTFEGRNPVFSKTIILDNFRAVDVRLTGTPILASLSELTEWRKGASLEDLSPYVWAELDEGQGFTGRHEVRVTRVEDDGTIHAQFSNESLSTQMAIEDLLVQAQEDANISKNRQHKVLLADEHLTLELGSNAHTNLTKETLADQVKLWKIDPSASEGFSEVTGDEKREGIDFDLEQIQALLEADEAGKHKLNFSFGDTLETRGTVTRQGSGQLTVELLRKDSESGRDDEDTEQGDEGNVDSNGANQSPTDGRTNQSESSKLPQTSDRTSRMFGMLGLAAMITSLRLWAKRKS